MAACPQMESSERDQAAWRGSFGARRRASLSVLGACAALVCGCASGPSGPPPPVSSGSAGGGTAVGADASLQTCKAPVGTVRLQDGDAPADTSNEVASNQTIQSIRLLLGSIHDVLPGDKGNKDGVSIDALRLLIQQSNCFVIVDRGASEGAATDEKRRTRSPNSEVRDNANMGPGQEVAADFVLRSQVLSIGTEQSGGFGLGALMPKFAQGVTGSESVTNARVQLVLSDVRSKIQLAVAQGAGSGKNTSLATGVLGRVGSGIGGGGVGTQSTTPAATVLLQAFADGYNKLVPAVRDYKTQNVKGGLGAGGNLGVQK